LPLVRTVATGGADREQRIAMQQKLFEDKADFIKQYRRACRAKYGKSFDNCRNRERFFVLAELIAENGCEAYSLAAKQVFFECSTPSRRTIKHLLEERTEIA
jgi:hypothetical protein